MNILVPVDFSPGSRDVLVHAAALAKSLGATVTLLHVFEAPTKMSGIVPGFDAVREVAGATSSWQQRLDELVVSADSHGVVVETDVEEGFAGETILRRATEGKFDLIVMGTHGRTGMARLIMGSVAESVLRSAPCPVMTLHLPHDPSES